MSQPGDRPTVREMADRITRGRILQDQEKKFRRSTSRISSHSIADLQQSTVSSIDRNKPRAKPRRNVPGHLHDATPNAIHITANVAAAYDKMRGHSRENPGPMWQRMYAFSIPDYKPEVPRSKEWRSFSPNLPALSPSDIQERDTNMIPDGMAMIYYHAEAPSKPVRPLELSFTAAAARDFARECDDSSNNFMPAYKSSAYAGRLLPRGDQAYEKYGYLLINGTWVDPDSEEQVLDAINGRTFETAAPLPIWTRGPRILTKAEEEREFDLLQEYVSDDEEDPRDDRRNDISPYLFLCWARDVKLTSRFIEVEETAQPTQQLERRKTQDFRELPRVHAQFDEETGSQLSGVYEIDHDPSPLWSPQGVEILSRPPTFARNNPKANLSIERSAYGKPKYTPHYLSQESADDREMGNLFTNQTALRALTTDGILFHGQLSFMEREVELNVLHIKRNYAMGQYAKKMGELHSLRSQKASLEKQNFFLRKRIEDKKKQAELQRIAEKIAREDQRCRELLQEWPERLSLDAEWATSMTERIHTKTIWLASEVEEKEREGAKLLAELGIDNVDELDDLYPKPPG